MIARDDYYQVLDKSKRHAIGVTSNLHIAGAILRERSLHVVLELVVGLSLHKTL